MPLDPLAIVNGALALISVEPIQSFEEEFAGSTCGLIYDRLVRYCVGIYPFSFAQEMRALTRLSEEVSAFGFAYVHQLPADRLGPPLRVTDNARDPAATFYRFTLTADQVHADANPLYALIKFLPDPARWSATFAQVMTLASAGYFAGTLADDFKARDSFLFEAFGDPRQNGRGGAMGAAIAEDGRATPVRRLPYGSDPFTQAHVS